MLEGRLIKYPSIGQYREVVKHVHSTTRFKGFGDNGDPIIDQLALMPTLSFYGTPKLHGTNAGIGFSPHGAIWTQSRENIITPEKDNAGFSMFVHANAPVFKDIRRSLVDYQPRVSEKYSVIFGEWCGQGVQKGVAVSLLPKMFVVFDIIIIESEDSRRYLTPAEINYVVHPHKTEAIKTIYEFPSWSMDIDFENPHASQNDLNVITEAVEAECPVGKAYGVQGIGEGVVWKCSTPGYEDSGFWFKVKGSKHSASKVKTLAKVDVDRINSVKLLSEQAANGERLEQMHQQVFGTLNGGETDITKMGAFIKAVMTDVFKEETDLIAASGFTGKELSSPISKICREFIMKKLEF